MEQREQLHSRRALVGETWQEKRTRLQWQPPWRVSVVVCGGGGAAAVSVVALSFLLLIDEILCVCVCMYV